MNLLLEQEQNTLREIKKIFICLCNFTDGKNNDMFNADMFKYQMQKYKESILFVGFEINISDKDRPKVLNFIENCK